MLCRGQVFLVVAGALAAPFFMLTLQVQGLGRTFARTFARRRRRHSLSLGATLYSYCHCHSPSLGLGAALDSCPCSLRTKMVHGRDLIVVPSCAHTDT